MVTVGEVTLATTQCLPPAQKIDLNYYFWGYVELKVPKKYYNYLAEVKKSEINQKYKISEIALITELLLLLLTTT